MPLEKIEIRGFRGFSSKQALAFAIPNGELGSGLTIITGANNSGKSSIVECLKARGGNQSPSFSVGARNPKIDKVEISYFINGDIERITSLQKGSSETNKSYSNNSFQLFVLPSRRGFNPYFPKGLWTRESFIQNEPVTSLRSSTRDHFSYRLFNIQKNSETFNNLLHKVLNFKPEWSIDQSDQGHYFLKFYNGKHAHTSDGMGEGIISIFAIVDSLYDSKPGDMVVIDEPELSLHPTLQKRVFSLINEYSKDRQIVISTHSPYFVDMYSVINGAHLARVVNKGKGTKIFQLDTKGREAISKLVTNNIYNPHTFGLNTKELFFQEDGIVVVEGQEDVILYPTIAEQLGIDIEASFFGWGAGGASNIGYICTLLKCLGFKKVAAIFDGDKREEISALSKCFPDYHFVHINADDIRTKKERKKTDIVEGLLDNKRKIKDEYKDHTLELLQNLNSYMVTL